MEEEERRGRRRRGRRGSRGGKKEEGRKGVPNLSDYGDESVLGLEDQLEREKRKRIHRHAKVCIVGQQCAFAFMCILVCVCMCEKEYEPWRDRSHLCSCINLCLLSFRSPSLADAREVRRERGGGQQRPGAVS